MDPEFVEYLDRRFTQLKDELRTELRADLRAELRADLRADLAASAEETRRYVDAAVAAAAQETRRHFDVMAESLINRVQVVAEGVLTVDRKVDRLADEMRIGFERFDRRFLHLEARVIDRRD